MGAVDRSEAAKPDTPLATSAFTEIFDAHYEAIFGYLRRRVGLAAAEDLAAETFLTGLRQASTFDPERGEMRPWLFGIASNLMRKEFRRETREFKAYARSGVDPLIDDSTASADQRIDAQSVQRDLAGGLALLRDDDREALLLFCWADLSYEEVATSLEVPLGTVKSRIARARKLLKSQLAGLEQAVIDSSQIKEAEHG